MPEHDPDRRTLNWTSPQGEKFIGYVLDLTEDGVSAAEVRRCIGLTTSGQFGRHIAVGRRARHLIEGKRKKKLPKRVPWRTLTETESGELIRLAKAIPPGSRRSPTREVLNISPDTAEQLKNLDQKVPRMGGRRAWCSDQGIELLEEMKHLAEKGYSKKSIMGAIGIQAQFNKLVNTYTKKEGS